MNDSNKPTELDGSEIAIVGMTCRLPGAHDIEAFWRNLVQGVESLTELSADELRRAGVDPAMVDDPDYVRAAPLVDGVELFDADFFGYTPLEAKIMDPQQRLFLECAWEAFEQAGYDPEQYAKRVGVFTGAKTNTYLFSLFSNRELFSSLDNFQIALGNDLATMATRISYKFNLRGPSYALHTACSTSLIAVHLACQSLLLGECDMALAGGSAVNVPQAGYRYQKGGILSPDGSCRTFDADAAGSNFGNGAGAVLLKRLDEAREDGDHVYAIIRGSAANNDGAKKASFTAPGVDGQIEVLLEAMAVADVDADTLSYIEAHGTATDLGDSIEMLALTEAFRASTQRSGYCAIGSVKTNLGHLEVAAGVAGLIKTALALENRQIPASLHFEQPNPKIDFENSPFYVNTELADWPSDGAPRRAGVSSFGIGSTNAHVIVEQAPPAPATSASRPGQLLLLSARSASALESMTANLNAHLERHDTIDLADVAFTLQLGRKGFEHRRALVCRDTGDAVEVSKTLDPARVFTGAMTAPDLPVTFLFPGLGDHYPEMGLGLYRSEPVYRRWFDRCAELLKTPLGVDLRELVFPEGTDREECTAAAPLDFRAMLGRGAQSQGAPADEASARLDQTRLAQPALFAVELALAKLWMSWGIQPQAMIGYSLGEYVVACLAGVMSVEDTLRVVAARARMIEELPEGAMLAVPLPEDELGSLAAGHDLSLAAVNGPATTVVSGEPAAVAGLEETLTERGVLSRRLSNTHAFHSAMMRPKADELTELLAGISLSAPEIPYLSNVTGTWITAEEATDPGYWARHMCQTVRFSGGIAELLAGDPRILLEVGPGQNLASFVKQHPDCDAAAASLVFPSMRNAYSGGADRELMLSALGKLWLTGKTVDWPGFYGEERRQRVPLPTYPFERQRHWVDPPAFGEDPSAATGRRVTLDKQADPADWLYLPTWRREPLPASGGDSALDGAALVFADSCGLAGRLIDRLRDTGREVVRVVAGERFEKTGEGKLTLDPRDPEGYVDLLAEAPGASTIFHLWSVSQDEEDGADAFDRHQDLGFYSLLHLAQALGRRGTAQPVQIVAVSSGIQRVSGDEALCPDKATLIGPARVIPQEFPRITCRGIDLTIPAGGAFGDEAEALVDALIAEAASGSDHDLVAYRDGERWVQDFEAHRMPEADGTPELLREEGVYLLTGGLGGVGLELAAHLARTVRAKLVLTRRSAFPAPEEWDDWLEAHDSDDPVAGQIRRLREIEELGSEVMAVSADVADEGRMREVVGAARQRFGAVDGVVHLAGIPGGGIIQLKTREMAQHILGPKAGGARVLLDLFADAGDAAPDFLVMFSSVASILGEFGQADYCGANALLDACAQNHRADRPRVITINWDIWQEVGLAVATEVPDHLKAWRQEMLEKAIAPSEGVEVFTRILGAGEAVPQVVVSAQDLPGRIELGKSFTGESFLDELSKAQGAPAVGAQAVPSASSAAPRRVMGTGFAAAGSTSERQIAEIWQRVLGIPEIGVNDNFFDLGGNSLIGLQLVSELSQELGVQIEPVTLFESPTVAALARHLNPEPAGGEPRDDESDRLAERRRRLKAGAAEDGDRDVAIIAINGRFPGARDVEQLWDNLRAGKESITFFDDQELLAAGIAPETFQRPEYVRAGAILEDVELFDAEFFGYSPREAEVMDPQHRVFLENAWEALEKAGYDPGAYPGSIGVFAGSNLSTYLLQMYADPAVKSSVNMLQAILGNDKDSLTTAVSYKLNLRGPSVAVQTFCSTSLVAVHMAVQSLRNGECDMALAGGIRIVVPTRQGYLYEQGGIAPSDGHSRSFDAKANGSVLGNGVGLVVLKRLSDALEDGDPIHAVIKGTAINNDGSLKAGYTAPSVAGQSEAIIAAFEDAGVEPESISYLEAHGSATELGDPIEVTALTQAYRAWTDEKTYCPIGSVKSNFGHLDRAAGVAGLIKTVLSMEHGQIPPSIHFEEPNPQIDFDGSPFYVNTELAEWPANGTPRRAGVNSLGMGGTNVHVIVEEAPALEPGSASRSWQLLQLSARSEGALETMTANLDAHLAVHTGLDLADVAYTLQTGRRAFAFRRAVLCRDLEDARQALAGDDPRRRISAWNDGHEREAVFMFAGLGGQYAGMGRGLYDAEPAFREAVDRCAEILEPHLGLDLRQVIYPETAAEAEAEDAAPGLDLRKMLSRDGGEQDENSRRLNETWLTQPALFVIEYATAQLMMEWGIRPRAMIGYSLGEYTAAAVAGVLSLPDALKLVAERAKSIHQLAPGALLAVALPEPQARELLADELSLMATNGPEQSVISGPVAAIETLAEELESRGVSSRRLQASHAFHSKMMEPLAEPLEELVRSVSLRPPEIPYLSNVTGTWITPEEATDPTYWSRHLCQPVRFSEGLIELLSKPGRVLVELGPGQTLTSLVLQHPSADGGESGGEPAVVATMRHSYESQPDQAYALNALGKLWLLGLAIDSQGFWTRERRRRVVLPTYPFERQRFWIDTASGTAGTRALPPADGVARLYLPAWKRAAPMARAAAPGELSGSCLILADDYGVGDQLAEVLQQAGVQVYLARAGDAFGELEDGSFSLDPSSREDFSKLLAALGEPPATTVHLWTVAPEGHEETDAEAFEAIRAGGFEGLLALGTALAARGVEESESRRLWAVTSQLYEVRGDEQLRPQAALVLGALQGLAREHSGLDCRTVDIVVPAGTGSNGGSSRLDRLVHQLATEITGEVTEPLVACRDRHRWVPTLEPAPAPSSVAPRQEGGVYLIVGGLGSLGASLAAPLAAAPGARLAIVEPAGFPARDDWEEWLERDGGEGVVSHAIHRARALEALGAQLMVIAADATERDSLERAVEQAEERFGDLGGVIHVAESDGGWQLEQAFTPWLLADLLAGRELDFRLLASPPAIAEGPHAAELAASGLAFDAFASAALLRGEPWTSVAWDLIREPDSGDRTAAASALDQLLAAGGWPQIVASPRPLPDGWHRFTAPPPGDQAVESAEGVGYYPRPSLRVEYVEPRNEMERAIAEVWGELLGVDRVGIHDSFLDLGGDSLLATRLISRLRDVLDLEVPIRMVFEASTVAELSAAAAEMRSQQEEAELAELVGMLDQLSEDEIEEQLRTKRELLGEEA